MGEEARVSGLSLDALMVFRLKNLREYRVTSPRCTSYNCVAWALADQTHWVQAEVSSDPVIAYYWPAGVQSGDTLEAWIGLFEFHGFKRCDDGIVEDGVTKLAIYCDDEGVSHVARQLTSGWWASKLGKNVDIEHRSYEELEGDYYGRVTVFMKRVAPDAEGSDGQ